MEKESAPEPVLNISFPPFLYYIGCLFLGTFLGSFLTYQITRDTYTLAECFLVHEAVGKEPEILGGSAVATPSGGGGESNGSGESGANRSVTSSLVNLNTATLAELDTLPGIGPVYAQRIIDGRPYVSIEELLKVKGIGPKTFEKIKDLLVL